MDLNRGLPYAVIAIISTFWLWSRRSRRAQRNFARSNSDDGEAEASSPPSSSTPPVKEDGFQYDVFLSFRGADVRKGFTSHLHHGLEDKGIVTFIDSEKLERGQKVDVLFECIQRSKIFVPIFSKGYADSEWCLKEIAKMVECKRLIVPVFIDVEPRDVRRQTGPFTPAFREYHRKKRMDKEEVNKWSAALTEAGNIFGYSLADTNGNEAKLIQLIVKRIMREVNKTPLYVVKHPVGLDSRIVNVMEMLDTEAQGDAKMVGIHGIGGMGKTTLAKAVYNQISTRFDACSFISNVRETTKQPMGLVTLQERLVRDVFNDKTMNVNSTDEGIGIIKQRIQSKKVLLVLDDVDDKSQLEALAGGVDWFCSGSRIIITTRDKQVLRAQRVLNLYELKGLDDNQSLQLFSWHAFGKEEPNVKFAQLSKKVVTIAAGMPLALEIFGSHFFDLKKVRDWRVMLERLQKDQNKHIHEKLKISYDVLDEEEKRVFLDIACFFIGKERKLATLMWEDCKFFPGITINVLVHKSLVNINDDTGEFEMHDHIRDMGRKIVQDEILYDAGMCNSRLWKDAETLDVLKNKREMKNVEAIQLFCRNFMSVSEEPFAAMFQLRMLRLGYKVQLEGRHQHFPSKLRWLEWHPRDLDSLHDGLYLESITVLDLSYSSITQLWNPQTSTRTKAFQKLKVLNLYSCENLTSCPDFKSMPHLQELNLGGCRKISALHPSIGHLKWLTHLSLICCDSLEELPVEIWQLTSLKEFDLSCCDQITILPPQNQLLLEKLKVLNLKCCRKLRLCPEFTSMPHLERLSFEGCGEMSELHPSIGCLKSLTYLSLGGCHSLKELPQQIWQLTSLETLDLRECYEITTWPSHLGDSESLKQPFIGNRMKVLTLDDCKNITKSPDFMSMPHIKILDFSGCEKMSELHPSIGHLKGLTELNLSGCKSLKELPPEIWQLTSLEKFNLSNCSQITALPSQLGDSKSLEQPLLGKLKGSNLTRCKNLTTCPDFMSMLKCLTVLDLSDCISLKELPEVVGQLTSLKTLALSSCSQISTLPESMGHLKQLNSLSLYECSSLKEVPKCIVSLDMLEELIVVGCEQLKFLPHLPPSLSYLDARGCHQLEIIANVSNLKGLRELCLHGCERLVDIPGIEKLKRLKTLELGGCRSLCNSFWEILQEVNFPALYEFSISESRIKCVASSPQSLSFLLPKQFENGSLYLYLEQGSMDRICSKLESEEGRYLASIFPEEADTSIPSDDEVTTPIDNQLGRVRIDITAEDSQYSVSTLVEWDDVLYLPTATFGSGRELMKRARDICVAQRKTLMMMHVSIDGCILLHGDFFTNDYFPLAKVGHNIVVVELG